MVLLLLLLLPRAASFVSLPSRHASSLARQLSPPLVLLSGSPDPGSSPGTNSPSSSHDSDDGPPPDIWSSQRSLMSSIKTSAQQSRSSSYRLRSLNLTLTTLLTSILIFSLLWLLTPSPPLPLSYLLGSLLGTLYTVALGKSVKTIGASEIDAETVRDGAQGQARFAFLLLLFVFIGRGREGGVEPVPAIAGFFTYFVGAVSESFERYDD